MVLDEQELRQRLKATAKRVSAPSFTVAAVASRIRRRRAKIIALASGSLLAVAAIAVAVPVTLSNPSRGPMSGPAPLVVLRVSFTVTVNGQYQVRPKNGSAPVFTLTPGKRASIRVGVIVAAHAKVTNLWLGIATAAISTPGPHGQRPVGMQPVLAHVPGQLAPGPHIFKGTWTMPAHLPRGASMSLAAGWQQADVSIGTFIAELVPPPGTVMSAAQACQQLMGRTAPGMSFSGVEQVRLVLTRYDRNQPVESTHDVGTAVPPQTLVWVIEVHAKAIHWQLPISPNHRPPARPTVFSVVMNARTAVMSDFGESNNWPLPLAKLGTVFSLPPQC